MKIGILGLDPGLTSTGWAYLEGDTATGQIKFTDHHGVIISQKWRDKAKTEEIPTRERIDGISYEIQKIITNIEPKYVVMEDFVFYGNRGKVTSSMPALIENLRMLGRAMGYEVEIFANGFWKKIMLKNHVASKNQIQHFVHRKLCLDTKLWDKKDKGGHIRDAMALALTQWQLLQAKSAPNLPKAGGMKHGGTTSFRWS